MRSGRRYKGSNIDSMRGWSSVHGASRANQYLLKPSGTALMLSEMAPGVTTPDDSWRLPCLPTIMLGLLRLQCSTVSCSGVQPMLYLMHTARCPGRSPSARCTYG